MVGVRALAKKELITRGTKRNHKPEIGFLLRRNQVIMAATIATAAKQVPIATAVIDEGPLELDSWTVMFTGCDECSIFPINAVQWYWPL